MPRQHLTLNQAWRTAGWRQQLVTNAGLNTLTSLSTNYTKLH